MRLAYVTTCRSADVNAWSGLGLYMPLALQKAGFQIESIGNLKAKTTWRCLLLFKKIYYSKILSKSYQRERDPAILMNYTSHAEKLLAAVDHDIVFSPSTLPIAHLKTDKPIVFWVDATFAGMLDYYPGWSNICSETIKKGNEIEQLALEKCRIAIYASEWAANSAIQNYNVDPAKVKVVQFGANLHTTRSLSDIKRIIDNKHFDICRLLFIGVDWERKGGDTALAVADQLNRRGIRTELHVVGCTPPGDSPEFVKKHGFISKKTEDGRKHLDHLFSQSHFLIVPSRAECYGLVFAEASSFGVPSLATRTGGIPSVIRDEKNGYMFPLAENHKIYCDYIEEVITSKEHYQELAISSFKEYSARLNWPTAGERVYELIHKHCN